MDNETVLRRHRYPTRLRKIMLVLFIYKVLLSRSQCYNAGDGYLPMATRLTCHSSRRID